VSRSSQLVLQASRDIFRYCKPWIFVRYNFRTNVVFQDLHSVKYANLLLLTTNWKMIFIVYYLFMFVFNWCINNLFVEPSEMTLCVTKGGNLHYVIKYNVIWANQKTESFVYHWLCPLAKFDRMCFPAFVGALDVILSVLPNDRVTFIHGQNTATNLQCPSPTPAVCVCLMASWGHSPITLI